MSFLKVGITTARINLSLRPTLDSLDSDWIWEIYFFQDINRGFTFSRVLSQNKNSSTAALREHNRIKSVFEDAGIRDTDKVILLFDEGSHTLRAIGVPGQNIWVDVDGFVKKTFTELNIFISSLKVY